MPNSDKWILLQYGKLSEGYSISDDIFRESLNQALYYAFISLPFTEALVKVGTARTGLSLQKRLQNIAKGRISENIITCIFSKDSDLTKENYLTDYPEQTPYWTHDICDCVRRSKKTDEILSEVDVKGLNIKWSVNEQPRINDINNMQLLRSPRASNQKSIIKRPLVMLFEAPWRHFQKLRTQFTNHYMNNKVKYPHENICVLCPSFEFTSLRENEQLLTLYNKYYDYWESSSNKKRDFIAINKKIPESLEQYTCNADLLPESINWLIKNWKTVQTTLNDAINDLMELLKGFWIWVFGFVDQQSAKYFEKVYQNDYISSTGQRIWNSATRSPHEKKWTNYKKGKRRSEPEIAGDDHPHLYWNNNTIDVGSKWVYDGRKFL